MSKTLMTYIFCENYTASFFITCIRKTLNFLSSIMFSCISTNTDWRDECVFKHNSPEKSLNERRRFKTRQQENDNVLNSIKHEHGDSLKSYHLFVSFLLIWHNKWTDYVYRKTLKSNDLSIIQFNLVSNYRRFFANIKMFPISYKSFHKYMIEQCVP